MMNVEHYDRSLDAGVRSHCIHRPGWLLGKSRDSQRQGCLFRWELPSLPIPRHGAAAIHDADAIRRGHDAGSPPTASTDACEVSVRQAGRFRKYSMLLEVTLRVRQGTEAG